VKGKTVTNVLSQAQLATYQPWLDNSRQLRELSTQLQQLSLDSAASKGGGPKPDREVRNASLDHTGGA
jgi:hypothetical protein